MAGQRCPLCGAVVPAGSAHCARCGARVAALPRHHRVERSLGVGEGVPPARRRVSTGRAALRGAAVGAVLAGACLLAGLIAQLARGAGSTVAGDALLVVVGAAVIAAAVGGGVRVRRWGEFDELRERAAAPVSAGRAGLIAAALPPLAALLVLAATR